jgi:hypothetical protein
MKNKRIQKISYLIIAFTTTMLLFSIAVLASLRVTLFNENFMIQASHQAEYADQLNKEITNKIQNLGLGSNLPIETFENVITTNQVQENVDTYVRAIYADIPYHLTGKKEIKLKMQHEIEKYAIKKKMAIPDSVQHDVDTLKNEAALAYGKYITIPYFLDYGQKIMQFKDLLQIVLVILVIICLLVMGLLYWLFSTWHHRFWRYLSYIFGGTSLMLVTLPIYIFIGDYISHIGVTSKSIYTFLTIYLTNFNLTFIYMGSGFMVCSGIFGLISTVLRRKKVHGKNSKVEMAWKKKLV